MATVPSIGRAAPAGAPADATRDLYERYGRQIFAYCLVQLRNREEAEDAVQTTFLNTFRALERGVVPELESAWLYKIAQHVCQTRQRSWSRRRRIESPEDFQNVQEIFGAPMRDGDEVAGLTEALRELPEQQRRAILLREWQGLSYKEIAEEMSLSQAAVETLIFRARRGLAQTLERLRASGDLGSVMAAIKSIVLGFGTKAAVTLVTVATTSVVAATPEARHQVIHFVDAVSPVSIAPAKPDRPAHSSSKQAAPPAHLEASPRPRVATAVAAATAPVVAHHATKTFAPKQPVHDQAAPVGDTHDDAPVAAPARSSAAPADAGTIQPKAAPPPVTGSGDKAAPAVAAVAPTVSGFTPESGPIGTIVQIAGRGFTGATAVRFGGASASFTVGSDGSVTAKVPDGGTGPITIVTPNGSVVSDGTFTVTAPATSSTPPPSSPSSGAPAFGGFSPSSGPAGTVVQLAGKGFTGATAVRFYGTNADYTVNSDTSITTRVPSGAISGPITVVTPNYGNVTSTASFTVSTATSPTKDTTTTTTQSTSAPAPTITAFNPTSAPVGTTVVISGKNFTGATSVKFNGTSADFTVSSDTAITTRVPSGATSGPLTVITPNGYVSGSFTVSASGPSIEGFSPSSAAVGATVTIGGRGLSGATSVKFNGVSASFSVGSDTQLTATVPSGATSGPVTVTTAAGTATSTGSFTVTAPAAPEISGFSPPSGAVGASVGIGGSHFTGATSVKFNGVSASFSVSSDGVIMAVVPAGATSGPVTVTTPNGTATSTSSFTVTH